MTPMNGGYSACSTGPVRDLTPEDSSSHHIPITDSPFSMSNYGPPYAVAQGQSHIPMQYSGGPFEAERIK